MQMNKKYKLRREDEYVTTIYMSIVVILFLIIYVPLILTGKTYIYIDIGADTYCSYWPNMSYVKQLLGDFKLWDMNLGLGFSTVTYICAVLLDPFNWPALLFSPEKMYVGIYIGLGLKYAFLSFFAYKYMEKRGLHGYSKVIASIMVVFSGWFVGWGQHYAFATVYVYFIMLLYFFELWMQEEKFVGLILSTALLATISPYFCYMILLFAVFYYFFSLYYRKKDIIFTNYFSHMFRTGGIFLLGIGCAGLAFIPYVGELLLCSRVTGDLYPSFKLGNLNEYISLFMRVFSNSVLGINGEYLGYANFYESPFMYIGIISIFGILFFIVEKSNLKRYWLAILVTVASFVFVNFFSIIFNGFSTKTYRWTFVYIPIMALVCGKALQEIDFTKGRRIAFILGFGLDIFIILFGIMNRAKLDKTILISYIFVLTFLNISMLIVIFINNKDLLIKCWMIVLAIEMCLNAEITVHERGIITVDDIENMAYFDASNQAIEFLEENDSSFYRISKKYANIDLNDSMFQNYRGEKLYSSFFTNEIWNMVDLFNLRIKKSNYLYGFDDKQILRNISSGKYRLNKVLTNYYGYDYIKTIDDVNIYENKQVSNFGVIYEHFLFKSEVDTISDFDLQEILLENCIIDDEDQDEELETVSRGEIRTDVKKKLLAEERDIEDRIVSINSSKNPLLVEIMGQNSVGSINIFTSDVDTVTDSYEYQVSDLKTQIYVDNLNVTKIQILNCSGQCSAIKVYELDGDGIAEEMSILNQNYLHDLKFSDTEIEGMATVPKESLLFIPIPYDKRWSVYINEKEVKVYRADAGFMAVVLPSGESKVTITYQSPYISVGVFISLISIAIMCILVFYKTKRTIVV